MIQEATIELVLVSCCECGLVFGIEKDYQARLRKNGESFYCPHGHSQWYGEGEADRLRKQLKEEQENSKWWQDRAETNAGVIKTTQRQLAATKGVLTKTKRRIAAGVCPCCHRQFVSLAHHMEKQHPDYGKVEAL